MSDPPPAAAEVVGVAEGAGESSGERKGEKRERDEEKKEKEEGEGGADGGDAKKAKGDEEKRKKRPYALCIGYIGTGYQGLQYNKGCRTIEDELVKAVHAAGGISDANMEEGESGRSTLQRVGWMRSSRTDKGVHARMNLVGLKLLEPPKGKEEQFVRDVNAALPKGIEMYALERVTNSFNAKNAVSHRYYSYVLPTYAFVPPEKYREIFPQDVAPLEGAADGAVRGDDDDDEGEDDDGEKPRKGKKSPGTPSPIPSTRCFSTVDDATFDALTRYRITPDRLDEVNKMLEEFVGTHHFHNYTRGRAPTDASCQRYVTEFKVVRVEEIDGMEIATISVKGASFMLHQIRRMVGMAVATLVGSLPPSLLARTMEKATTLYVPTAPPTGLLLDHIVFDYYNHKLENLKTSRAHATESHRPLLFTECVGRMDIMHASIRAEIMRQEQSGRVMASWLRSVPHILHTAYQHNLYAPGNPPNEGPA